MLFNITLIIFLSVIASSTASVNTEYSTMSRSSPNSKLSIFTAKPSPTIIKTVKAIIRDISGTPPPESGDWIINDTTIISDSKLIINGSIIIDYEGTLVLLNSEIYINLNDDGEHHIKIYGNLTAINSVITSLNSNKYYLVAYPHSFVKIENSRISHAGYTSIGDGLGLLFNSSTVIVKGSNISNCMYGLYLLKVNNALIENSSFSDVYYAVYMEDTNNTVIQNNTFTYARVSMITIGGASVNNTIYNNRFSGLLGTAIITYGGAANNYIENNVFVGIGISEGGTANYIQYNKFINSSTGISFVATKETVFKHNILENSSIDYINSEALVFENNTIDGKPVLYIHNASSFLISDEIYGEIILDSTIRVQIRNITITNTYRGILIEDSSYITVENCFFDNVSQPIKLRSTKNPWILENTIINTYTGIDLYDSQNALIKNNIIKNIRLEGIHLATGSDNAIVAYNKIYNADSGIRTFNSYNITIANNTIVSSTKGLSIVDTNIVYVYLNNLIDNFVHFDSDNSEGIVLHSPEELEYSYKGQTFKDYLGNYWSGYESTDSDNNGIWDEPYIADQYDNISDEYPLVSVIAFNNNQIILSSKPTIQITSPEDMYVNTTQITITWTADDPDNDIDHYELYVDETLINSNISADITSYTINISEGTHQITLIAIDEAGNSASDSKILIVDVTPPKILILSPHTGTTINSSTVIVKWNITDNLAGVDHIEIYVDDELVDAGISPDKTSYTITLASGTHKILLKAYDKAGNSNSALILIRVNTTESISQTNGGSSSGTTGYMAVGIIAAVVLVVVVIIALRKKT